MYPTRVRSASLEASAPRDEFVAVVHRLLAQLERQVELLAVYGAVCLFWGVILYAAFGFALP